MVQIIQTGPSRRRVMSEMISQELGKGLGSMANSYFATKALDRVTNDKSLQDKPLSEKYLALQAALQPFGEVGEQVLQKRLQIEQLHQQEQQQKLALEKEQRLFQQQKELQELKNKARAIPLENVQFLRNKSMQ